MKITIKTIEAIKITVVPVIIFPLLSIEFMDKLRIIFLILVVEVRLCDFFNHLYIKNFHCSSKKNLNENYEN